MISPTLLSLVRCPDCRGTLSGQPTDLTCGSCGRQYHNSPDFLDLRPKTVFAEMTKYVDEALHADQRQETVAPPVLGAALRNDQLRAFLRPAPGDRIVDLGCGSGRALLWNRELGAYAAGVDVSPYFAREARGQVDLTLADLRQLPFADGSFSKAYMLDVLEHLSPETLNEVLREASRILTPDGVLFVYSHVRKNSRLAAGLKNINRLARVLERRGWIDLTQERLRKSDHVNPLADLPDLHRVVAASGFHVERIRYYTPLVGGFIENILVRVAEAQMMRRIGARQRSVSANEAHRIARSEAKAQVARRGATYRGLRMLTWMMQLDLVLFGHVPSGPFFALLRKDGTPGIPAR